MHCVIVINKIFYYYTYIIIGYYSYIIIYYHSYNIICYYECIMCLLL
jgi:hypothetical protein